MWVLQKILQHQTTPKQKPRRVLKPSNIDKNTPWDFFDGASQGEPPLGGVGGILFMNETTKTKITFSPGHGTNNKEKLSALWSVLRIASKNHVRNLQLFGDSKMSIDWENGQLQINAPHLQNLLRAIRDQM